jgi:type I restriction enzyme S subunit
MEDLPTFEVMANRWKVVSTRTLGSGIPIHSGDLLVAKITPCFENGKLGIVGDIPGGWGYATTEVHRIRARPGFDLHFLSYLFRHGAFRRRLADGMEGTTGRKRLPRAAIGGLSVPLPPLSEQRSIARILLTIQEATRPSRVVEAAAVQLRHALRRSSFSEASWPQVCLGDVCSVSSGGTPSRTQPQYWGGSVPWVKTGEIDYNIIRDTSEKITELALTESAARLYPTGTILLAMYGDGVTRGRVARLGIEAAVNQACAAIRPTDEHLASDFLYQYLAASYEELRALGHGANQRNLSASLIEAFSVPVPPLEEQRAVARMLNALDAKVSAEASQRAAGDRLLRASIAHLLDSAEVAA